MTASTNPKTRGDKSTAQIKAIFGLARKRDLSDDALRAVAETVTGQRSISALTRAAANNVIVALGGVVQGTADVPLRTRQYRRQRAGVKRIVSPAQLEKLRTLAAARHWSDRTVDEFCTRQCGHARPRTTTDANKIIEALKAMNARDARLKGVA